MRLPRRRRPIPWRGLLLALALAPLLAAGTHGAGAPPDGSARPAARSRLPALEPGYTLLTLGEREAALYARPVRGRDVAGTSRRLAALGPPDGADAARKIHTDAILRLHRLYPAPGGARAALQGSTSKPLLWLLEFDGAAVPALSPLPAVGYGEFLAWHPDGRRVLIKMLDEGIADPGLWLVDTRDGSHRRIELPELAAPEGLLAAAVAPDGARLLYSITRGLGTGSSLWLTDLGGSAHERLRDEPHAVIGGLRWSPDGERAAYVTGLDSPVPFAPAVLWTLSPGEGEPRRMAITDGGHGQAPLWSGDGRTLYYIARDNPASREANRDPAALVSSIHAVDVRSGESRLVVPADGARQIDLALAPDGDLLFASTRGGALAIWRATPDGRLTRLTSGDLGQRSPLLIEIKD